MKHTIVVLLVLSACTTEEEYVRPGPAVLHDPAEVERQQGEERKQLLDQAEPLVLSAQSEADLKKADEIMARASSLGGGEALTKRQNALFEVWKDEHDHKRYPGLLKQMQERRKAIDELAAKGDLAGALAADPAACKAPEAACDCACRAELALKLAASCDGLVQVSQQAIEPSPEQQARMGKLLEGCLGGAAKMDAAKAQATADAVVAVARAGWVESIYSLADAARPVAKALPPDAAAHVARPFALVEFLPKDEQKRALGEKKLAEVRAGHPFLGTYLRQRLGAHVLETPDEEKARISIGRKVPTLSAKPLFRGLKNSGCPQEMESYIFSEELSDSGELDQAQLTCWRVTTTHEIPISRDWTTSGGDFRVVNGQTEHVNVTTDYHEETTLKVVEQGAFMVELRSAFHGQKLHYTAEVENAWPHTLQVAMKNVREQARLFVVEPEKALHAAMLEGARNKLANARAPLERDDALAYLVLLGDASAAESAELDKRYSFAR